MNQSTLYSRLACTLILAFASVVRAESIPEAVWFNEGEVLALRGGQATLLTEDIQFPKDINVSTNGTFQVGSHPPRPFVEGQILGADGMLLSPNGKIEPVIDHVALEAGRTVSAVNGEGTPVSENIQLGHKLLTPDRVLLGSWMRVIDGQLFTPDGETIPAIDTISLQQGTVVVQKEGTQLTVGPGRSIMMNEGTKVFGDGTVVHSDGAVTELVEGQILTIQGVVKLR